MYTLLSHLPDNVPYKCPDCDSRGAKAKRLLDEELKAEDGKKRCGCYCRRRDSSMKITDRSTAKMWAITSGMFHHGFAS